jgi:hypothetical protein
MTKVWVMRRDIGDIDLTVLDNITAKKNKGADI